MAPPTPYRTAPNSMRPRIGSGVSGAFLAGSRSHDGTPRWILSTYLPKTRRVNRRAAGPDPEPRSPALPEPTKNPRPVSASSGAESNGVMADLGPLSATPSCNGGRVSITGHTGTNGRERHGLVDPVRRTA